MAIYEKIRNNKNVHFQGKVFFSVIKILTGKNRQKKFQC